MPSARRRTWVDVSDSGDCQVPSEQMMMFFMIPPVLGVNWSSFFGGYHALLSAPVSWGPPAPQPTYRTWQSPYPPHSRNQDRKSTRLNSSHVRISYAVFCLKKKNK